MTAVAYSAIPELKKEEISFVDAVKTPLADPVNLDAEKGTFRAWFSAVKDTVSNYFESKKFDSHINNLKQFERIDQNFAENLSAWSKVDKGMPSAEVKAVYGQVGTSLVDAAQSFRSNYEELNKRLVQATGMNLREISDHKHDSLSSAQKAEVNKISKEFCSALKTNQENLKGTIEKAAAAADSLRINVAAIHEHLEKDVTNLTESSRKLRGELGYTGYVPALPQDGMNLFVDSRKEIVTQIAKSDTLQKKGADEFVSEIQDATGKLKEVATLAKGLNKEIEKTHTVLASNQKQRSYLANELDKVPEGAEAVKVSRKLVSSLSTWFDKQERIAINGNDKLEYSTAPGEDSLRMTLGRVKSQEDLLKAKAKVGTFAEESQLNRAMINSIGKGMQSFNQLLEVGEGAKLDPAFKKLVIKTQSVYEKKLIDMVESGAEPAALRTEVLKVLDSIDSTVKALKNYDEKFVKEFSAFTNDKSKDPVVRESAKILQASLQQGFNKVFAGSIADEGKFNKEMESLLEAADKAFGNTKRLDEHLRNKVPDDLRSKPIDKEAASLIKEAQELYISKTKEISKECENYESLNKTVGQALVRYAQSFDGFIELAQAGKPNMSYAEYTDMMDGLRADLDKISGKGRFSL
jgi:hypothetical protein